MNSIKVLLPPLHINLRLTKNFLKTLHKRGDGFPLLAQLFPNLSDANVTQRKSVGPKITKAIFIENFERKLNFTELAARKFF
jgi:hypothetical protein